MRKQGIGIASVLITVIILLMAVLPAAAEYHETDVAQGQCVHIELNTSALGEYFFIFFNEGEFYKQVDISTTEPNTTIQFDVLVTPQTQVVVATPAGIVIALVLDDGYFFYGTAGNASLRVVPLDVVCLGAKTDGRLNRFDKAMLAVIYPDGHDGYDIWKIDPSTSEGTFDYNVSSAEVAAGLSAAEGASQSQAIASSPNSTFYTTPDHQCVVISPNAGGEPQRFDFDCGT